MTKTVTNWQGIHSVPLVPLRVMTGLLMIHHGSEGTHHLLFDGGLWLKMTHTIYRFVLCSVKATLDLPTLAHLSFKVL
jgi:hypothetical protein